MKAMPASQRPHETRSGGISLTSSLAETLRPLKNRPDTTARKKPRATGDGMSRDSESGASRTGADIRKRLALCPNEGQGAGFASPCRRPQLFSGQLYVGFAHLGLCASGNGEGAMMHRFMCVWIA